MKFKIASSHCALNENRAALLEVSIFMTLYSSLSRVDIVLKCLVDTYLWWKGIMFFFSLISFTDATDFVIVSQHNWILTFTFTYVFIHLIWRKLVASIESLFPIMSQMEGIPSKARNLQMNLMMGKLYRSSRHTRAAVTCYKECLRSFMFWFFKTILFAYDSVYVSSYLFLLL